MSVGISLAIIGSVAFGGAIAWLAWEAISAQPVRPWDDFKDRINTVPESYAEAIQMIPANNDKPVGQFTKWPEVTEEELISIHEGRHR